MRRTLIPFALLAIAAGPALAEEPRRQLEAHVHGEGRLAIAIEGNRVEMDLETPAADIVGFEQAPADDAQRQALATAIAQLTNAASLFVMPPAAGCKLGATDVDALGALADGKDVHADHDHKQAKPGEASEKGGEARHAHSHAAFKATYEFECAAPDKIGTIAFEYFKAFKGADKLDVTVIGPKGQSSFVVTREKPVLDLGGLS